MDFGRASKRTNASKWSTVHGCRLHPNMSKMRVRRYDAQTTIYRADGWVSKKSIFWQHHSICICHTLLKFKRFCHVQTFFVNLFQLVKAWIQVRQNCESRQASNVGFFLRFEGSRQNSVINSGSFVPKWRHFWIVCNTLSLTLGVWRRKSPVGIRSPSTHPEF